MKPGPVVDYVLRYPIRVGTCWIGHDRTTIFLKGTRIAEHDVIRSLHDKIKVPAGSFAHCMRVEAHGKTLPDSHGRFVSVDTKHWLARGVGLVKLVHTATMAKPHAPRVKGTFVWQLEDVTR